MAKHGVYVTEKATQISTPVAVETGIPFIIGLSPIINAENPANVGAPTLITSLAEFRSKLGWSEDFATYNLCEFAYAHFVLYGSQPAIFVNLLDPTTHKSAVAAADKNVEDHKVVMTVKAIDDAGLVVKAQGGNGDAYVKDTDYSVYYNEDGKLVVELISTSAHYTETKLNIAYNEITPASITGSVVAGAMDKVDLCMAKLGIVPDLIAAPGFSTSSTVAAVMAAKADGINGMFKARALVDVNATTADAYDEVIAEKNTQNMTDKREIVCWPKLKLGDYTFHMSSHAAGLIAQTDAEYGAPCASPSNHVLRADSLVDGAGNEIILTKAQADILNAGGIVTGLNFMGGFRLWGNYTGAEPGSTDVKDIFIPVGRMFDYVNNVLIQTFWSRLDEPMTRMFVDSIVNTCNIWINGLVGSGYLLGGRVEFLDEENPETNLIQGIVKLHVYLTPPTPAQEIDFVLEYDASYVAAAFA